MSATMVAAPVAANDETGRLSALDCFDILDSEAEPAFDRVTSLAARLFRTPIALIGFTDRERHWFKSRIGIEAHELPRGIALCDDTLRSDGVTFAQDLWRDARFADTPATVELGIRFYAGAPLVTRDDHRIGTICVMDRKPRPDITAENVEVLAQLASIVMSELELRLARRQLGAELSSRSLAESRLKLLNDLTEAALEAPDFKAAIGACLHIIAGRVGADCAVAYGLRPNATRLELEAEYTAPGLDADAFLDFVRRFPTHGDNSLTGEAVLHQRLIAVADLSSLDSRRFPISRTAADHGFRSWLGVPFENAGAKFGLTFLFRRPLRDMSQVAETIHSLSGKVRDLLARKQTEERIALLQSVVLHANDAVMITEAGAPGEAPRIVYVNRSFTAMTGYPEQEVLGCTPHFLQGPATDPATSERVRTALARWEPVRVELINYRKDGGRFWAEMDIAPVADTNGWYTHWISILRETTARKQSEDSLRERELRLQQLADHQAAILDALPAHVALLDPDGSIVSVSRSWHDFAAASGIDAPAPLGRSYLEFGASNCWAELGPAITEGLGAVLAGRLPQFSIDHPCDQGGWRRWYRFMAAPLVVGRAEGAVVMHLDVTSNKLAEEALRREKEFSEFLIKSSTEGIVVFDREFRITLWNPGMERITGLPVDRVLGQRIFDVLNYLIGTVGEAAMRSTLDGRETSLYDQRYAIAESGREGNYDGFFSPLYSRGREVIGGIGFLRETTERRRIEDALRQSQKMEAVGQLTGGIAHDFNNMLTVIAGNLELLEGKLGNEPRLLRLVTSAALAASRAEKLTQQLLTFSRRQQLRSQPIDFNQIVIGMDDLLHRTVGEHIEIRKLLAAELWPALADPNQIETALLNLILNARDSMPGGGHITIETSNTQVAPGHREFSPGAYAVLSVADTGQGMSDEVLAHVFEPFFTTKEVGKGTGLGLSQVYGFVKQSAGHVKIDSRPGGGTTVRLYLPRAEGAVGTSGGLPIREQQYRGSECVLVVEDDHGVRDFAVSVLRELGYNVLEAANGDAGLAVLDGNPDIDLLFTDVVMPGTLSGADLAKVALERRPELRVLFTSGYTTRLVEKEWPGRTLELLRKPYRSVDLAARVRAVLNGASTAAE
jgi:PAS domain S-box-containing protein